MGSYGIGITRVMATIVEIFSNDKGIIWPEAVAPFKIHLVSLFRNYGDEVYKISEEIYEKLHSKGVEILFDDREGKSVGEKLSDADLIGTPIRVIVSEKSLESGGVEMKRRNEVESTILNISEFLESF